MITSHFSGCHSKRGMCQGIWLTLRDVQIERRRPGGGHGTISRQADAAASISPTGPPPRLISMLGIDGPYTKGLPKFRGRGASGA